MSSGTPPAPAPAPAPVPGSAPVSRRRSGAKRKVTPKTNLGFPENPSKVTVRRIVRDASGKPVLDAAGNRTYKKETFSVGQEVSFLNVHAKNDKNYSSTVKARIERFAIIAHTGVVRAVGTVIGKTNQQGKPQILSMMMGSFDSVP